MATLTFDYADSSGEYACTLHSGGLVTWTNPDREYVGIWERATRHQMTALDAVDAWQDATHYVTPHGDTVMVLGVPSDYGIDADLIARTIDGAVFIIRIQWEHTHTYRADISDWWCAECDTVTDYCQQINP